MYKEINFRIIELPTHQVLLMKDYDYDKESTPILAITLFVDGMKAVQKLDYSDNAERDKTFEEFTIQQAQLFLDATNEMFSGK